MPIYEYECRKCGGITEVFQKFSDSPLKKCNKCSGKVHKLISHSTFHLKGTGWYVTDYANKSGGASAASGGESKPTSGAKAKKETKTASTKKNKVDRSG